MLFVNDVPYHSAVLCCAVLCSGAGRYSLQDFSWCVSISGRGTAAVIDGHQVLLTPLR